MFYENIRIRIGRGYMCEPSCELALRGNPPPPPPPRRNDGQEMKKKEDR